MLLRAVRMRCGLIAIHHSDDEALDGTMRIDGDCIELVLSTLLCQFSRDATVAAVSLAVPRGESVASLPLVSVST